MYYQWQWHELDLDRDQIARDRGYEDWEDMQEQLQDDKDYQEYLRIEGK